MSPASSLGGKRGVNIYFNTQTGSAAATALLKPYSRPGLADSRKPPKKEERTRGPAHEHAEDTRF